MNIHWEKEALNDLENIRTYIEEDNPVAAQKTVKQIIRAVSNLPSQPLMGRPGRVPTTRELILSNIPYIIPYRVIHKRIFILRVFHTARQWPKG